MSRFAIPNSAFTNVVPGSTATLNVSVDRRYHHIRLEFKRGGALATRAQILTDITLIELKINGRVLRSIKPSFLFAMQALRGHSPPDGYIDLFFSEPWMRLPTGEDQLAWNVKDQASTFQIDVDIAAGVPTPVLQAVSYVDGGTNENGQLIPWRAAKRWVTQVIPVSATGPYTLNTMPLPGLYKAIYLFEDTDNDVSAVRLKVDSVELYNLTRDRAEAGLPINGTAQAGVFPVIFDYGNRLSEGISTHTPNGNKLPWDLEIEMAAANPVTMVAEFMGAPLQ